MMMLKVAAMERALGELVKLQRHARLSREHLLGPFEIALNFTVCRHSPQDIAESLEHALREIDHSAQRRYFRQGLYGLDVLASTNFHLRCDPTSEVCSLVRGYFVLLPLHNPSMAALLAGASPCDTDRGRPEVTLCDLGTVPAGPPFYHHDAPQVLAARDPATPGPLLADLAGTLSAVSALARRNPALPSADLRRYLAGGVWDAWCNPSAALELLMAPSPALDAGAISAARDAVRLPPWGLRGVLPSEQLEHLLSYSGRDVAEEEVLDAIAKLYSFPRQRTPASRLGSLRLGGPPF